MATITRKVTMATSKVGVVGKFIREGVGINVSYCVDINVSYYDLLVAN